jgi:hypothetical protein
MPELIGAPYDRVSDGRRRSELVNDDPWRASEPVDLNPYPLAWTRPSSCERSCFAVLPDPAAGHLTLENVQRG